MYIIGRWFDKGGLYRQGIIKCDIQKNRGAHVSYLVCAGSQFTGIIIDHIMLLGLYTGIIIVKL